MIVRLSYEELRITFRGFVCSKDLQAKAQMYFNSEFFATVEIFWGGNSKDT